MFTPARMAGPVARFRAYRLTLVGFVNEACPGSGRASRPVEQRKTESNVTKRTFQPNNRRRAKTHGFRLRMRTRAGRAIISARRGKGRARLCA